MTTPPTMRWTGHRVEVLGFLIEDVFYPQRGRSVYRSLCDFLATLPDGVVAQVCAEMGDRAPAPLRRRA